MVPSQAEIDTTLELVVKRVSTLKGFGHKGFIKAWMNTEMNTFNHCTPMDYIYIGLGYVVLNTIDDLIELEK